MRGPFLDDDFRSVRHHDSRSQHLSHHGQQPLIGHAPGDPIEPTLWKELVAPWRSNVPDKVYKPVGCLECRNTGYLRRTGLIEMLVMTDAMRALISQEGDIVQMRSQAARDGLRSLRVSGAEKIAAGVTTADEVLKAAPPFTT